MLPDKKSPHPPKPQRNFIKLAAYGLLATIVFGMAGAGLANLRTRQSALQTPSELIAQIEASPERPEQAPLEHRTYELTEATIHVVTFRPYVESSESVSIHIGIASELETVEAIAQRENAITAINAGFFDPQNGKTTSFLFSEGQLAGDPNDNERLVGNPALIDYLPQILDRSEFRLYRCGNPSSPDPSSPAPSSPGSNSPDYSSNYEIARRSSPEQAACQIDSAVGAGPQLLPENTSTAEAFTDYANGELIRDAIGSMQPNARSAIALLGDPAEILLIMVAQRPGAPGMTLAALADFAAAELNAEALLNLDGGSSSTLYYDGQTYAGRLDTDGNPIERPVKSAILIK